MIFHLLFFKHQFMDSKVSFSVQALSLSSFGFKCKQFISISRE